MSCDGYYTLLFDHIVHETDDAYLLQIGDRQEWIPKSLCEEMDGDIGVVDVAEWKIEEMGLEDFCE